MAVLKLLTPVSYQHIASPYNVYTLPNKLVMRILELISWKLS